MENSENNGHLVVHNVPAEYKQRVDDDKKFFEGTPGGKNNLKLGLLFHRYMMEGVAMKDEEMMTICVEDAKRLRDKE